MVTENNYKYLKPPTIEQIEAVVKKAGVSEAQFERYHSIYDGAIRKVRYGSDDMPSKHWHLFLEPDNNPVRNLVSRPLIKTPRQRTKPSNSPNLSRLTS